ncbi:MAG: hypothetical protein J2P58_08060 [Acidimicrobiaceae bacterium]|nr:hypothetical protein [Acidimicrobiaceae bacterium]MBO0746781.1 hypothetical protein [Acidimicrobiaceae bacterium]
MQQARLGLRTLTAPSAKVDRAESGRLERIWSRLRKPESIVTLAVLATCTIFTFVQLQPSQLFKNTTPAGGDMGAHVWLPAFVKAHLIPNLRLTGWAPDWYEGFPALTYYFPLPMYAIAFASYVIPYNVAFKLVSVAGLVALPVCAWAFGRLARLPFPGPPCLAVGALAYLFGREFTIYGGNIASTMAGEFSFSISLSFALLFLGVVARGMSNGRLRAIAAVLLACTALSHILPTFFAVGGALVLFALRWDRRRWRWLVPVLVAGGFLAAVWALPFEYRLSFATNMGYQKITTYLSSLFLPKELWLYLLAGVGFALSLARRRQVGIALGILSILCIIVFRYAPQARLWNARVLPFWFLCLYLLAALALSELGSLAVEAFKKWPDYKYLGVPVVALLLGLIWVGYPLWNLPFGHTITQTQTVKGQATSVEKYDWLGITSTDHSFVSGWVTWNYSGYQAPTKARGPEYFALINAMKGIGLDKSLGCGTALWQYEPELNDMGTPDALMLLPYWTNGCIGSEEGLYYESSASTPYHFLNAAEVSEQPSNPMVGLDYPSGPNVAEGVQHMQILGVKYFMAETPKIEAAADKNPALKLIRSVGPFPVNYTSGSTTTKEQRTWKIYEVADASLVTPLTNRPVVLTGLAPHDKKESTWLADTQYWYLNSKDWTTYETASGPKDWTRVNPTQPTLPQHKLPAVKVSHIRQHAESISFDVSRTGVPVLVKESYFPNWHAAGAGEVYRASPNLMIVVPTSRHVTLRYGYTPVDWIGFILTLIGVAGVVEMARRKVRFDRPEPAVAGLERPAADQGWPTWAGSEWRPDPDDPSLDDPTPPEGTRLSEIHADLDGGGTTKVDGDGDERVREPAHRDEFEKGPGGSE